MAIESAVGNKVTTRLDHGFTAPRRRQRRLDGAKNLLIREGDFFDILAIEIGDVDGCHSIFLLPRRKFHIPSSIATGLPDWRLRP